MLTAAELASLKELLRKGPMAEGNLPYAGPQGLCDRGWAIRDDGQVIRLTADGRVAQHMGLHEHRDRPGGSAPA